MLPALNDFSLFKNNDVISVAHGAEAMSYYDNSLAVIEACKIFNDSAFVIGIEGVGCLIEEDIRRIFVYSPCYENTLFLSLT